MERAHRLLLRRVLENAAENREGEVCFVRVAVAW
jgi:hypothetical protein